MQGVQEVLQALRTGHCVAQLKQQESDADDC
jgi:hypothetical protein